MDHSADDSNTVNALMAIHVFRICVAYLYISVSFCSKFMNCCNDSEIYGTFPSDIFSRYNRQDRFILVYIFAKTRKILIHTLTKYISS